MNADSSSPSTESTSASAPVEIKPLPERSGMSDEERALERSFRERYASQVEGLVVRREIPNPRVTLVVVSFRAGDYLLDCLRHLRAQTAAVDVPYEILVADSGGLEHLRERYGNLVDVDLRLKYGLPLNVARNAAMAYARGEFVAYIDDDGLVAPDWVEQALAIFEDPSIVAARGRIFAHKHPYYNAWVAHYDRGDEIWDEGSLSLEGNMMIRRQCYMHVGGFPDDVYGSEGLVLGFRLSKAFPGKRSVYAPKMVMLHDYCRSVREFIWKSRKYRNIADSVLPDDAEYQAYRLERRSAFKPQGKLTFDKKVARRVMVAAQGIIAHISLFDRVKRR
ncbi:MAG TPA: glycosyltransferase family 2 protein [Polyangium sp.]|nr:glycosyltransferase family 2 protein [Polyangium sp.]